MARLTDDDLHAIAEIIRRHHTELLAGLVGPEALTVEERDLLRLAIEEGRLPIPAGIDAIQEAYLIGQLQARLPELEAADQALAEAREKLRSAPIPLTEVEQTAVRIARHEAASAIRNLTARMSANAGRVMSAVERAGMESIRAAGQERKLEPEEQERAIRHAVAEAIARRETVGRVATDLRRMTEEPRDWNRVAVTELQNSREAGVADGIARRSGADVWVFKRPRSDCCKHCARLYLDENGYPVVFQLSWLRAQGTNVGRKAQDWRPVVGTVHAHCACVLQRIPDGWGFDDRGRLAPKGPHGQRIGPEEMDRRHQKSLALEDQLAKAAGRIPESWVEIPDWLGLHLWLREEAFLAKGAMHKYVRRIPDPTGRRRWRYFYSVGGGQGLGHASEMTVGAKFRLPHEGKEGHFEVRAVHDDGHLTLHHDESGQTARIHRDTLRAMLHQHHAEAIRGQRARLDRDAKAAAQHGTPKQQARIEADRKRFAEQFPGNSSKIPGKKPQIPGKIDRAPGAALAEAKPAAKREDLAPGARRDGPQGLETHRGTSPEAKPAAFKVHQTVRLGGVEHRIKKVGRDGRVTILPTATRDPKKDMKTMSGDELRSAVAGKPAAPPAPETPKHLERIDLGTMKPGDLHRVATFPSKKLALAAAKAVGWKGRSAVKQLSAGHRAVLGKPNGGWVVFEGQGEGQALTSDSWRELATMKAGERPKQQRPKAKPAPVPLAQQDEDRIQIRGPGGGYGKVAERIATASGLDLGAVDATQNLKDHVSQIVPPKRMAKVKTAKDAIVEVLRAAGIETWRDIAEKPAVGDQSALEFLAEHEDFHELRLPQEAMNRHLNSEEAAHWAAQQEAEEASLHHKDPEDEVPFSMDARRSSEDFQKSLTTRAGGRIAEGQGEVWHRLPWWLGRHVQATDPEMVRTIRAGAGGEYLFKSDGSCPGALIGLGRCFEVESPIGRVEFAVLGSAGSAVLIGGPQLGARWTSAIAVEDLLKAKRAKPSGQLGLFGESASSAKPAQPPHQVIKIGPRGGKIIGYLHGDPNLPIYESAHEEPVHHDVGRPDVAVAPPAPPSPPSPVEPPLASKTEEGAKPAAPPSPPPLAPKRDPLEVKLEGVGEHAWGDRKDLASIGPITSAEQLQGLGFDDAAFLVSKKKLVPEFDLAMAKGAGVSPGAAVVLQGLFASIKQQPGKSKAEMAKYIEEIRSVVGALQRVKTVEQARQLCVELVVERRAAPKYIPEEFTSSDRSEIHAKARAMNEKDPSAKYVVIHNRTPGRMSGEAGVSQSGAFRIAREAARPYDALGRNFVAFIERGGKAYQDTMRRARAAEENGWSWIETAKPAESPKKPKADRKEKNTERGWSGAKDVAGEVERIGGRPVQDASPDRIHSTFGFAEVGYGEAGHMTQADREYHTRELEGALLDLSEILGVPARALSIGGQIGVEMGASGRGKAAAHYSPTRKRINITKFRGGGTIAHEWGHALDNLLGEHFGVRQDKQGRRFLSEAHAGSTPEVEAAIAGVMQAIKGAIDPVKAKADHAAHTRMLMKEGQRLQEEMTRNLNDRNAITHRPTSEEHRARHLGLYETQIAGYEREKTELAGQRPTKHVRDRLSMLDSLIAGARERQEEVRTRRLQTPEDAQRLVELQARAKDIQAEHKKRETEWRAHMRAGLNEKSGEATKAGSDFYKSAQALGEYWASDLELFARAFESHIEDELGDRGRKSTYLVDGTAKIYKTGKIIPSGAVAQPYPHGEERKRISAAMGQLLATLKRHGHLQKALRGDPLRQLLKGGVRSSLSGDFVSSRHPRGESPSGTLGVNVATGAPPTTRRPRRSDAMEDLDEEVRAKEINLRVAPRSNWDAIFDGAPHTTPFDALMDAYRASREADEEARREQIRRSRHQQDQRAQDRADAARRLAPRQVFVGGGTE